MKYFTKLIFLLFLFPSLADGQGFDSNTGNYDTLSHLTRVEIAKQAYYRLKDGVLIVRFRTGNSQMKALQRMVDSPDISQMERDKFALRMTLLQDQIAMENNRLRQAFRENFFFTDVLYMPDTAVHLLKNGVQQGYFLNENLETDPSISLDNRGYLIAFYGLSASSKKMGGEGITVLDRDFRELVAPFPHHNQVSDIRKALGKWLNNRSDSFYFDLMVQRFQTRLVELSWQQW